MASSSNSFAAGLINGGDQDHDSELVGMDATFGTPVDHVKCFQHAAERVLKNVMGDATETCSFSPSDVVDSIRFNAEQDIKDLVGAHGSFEQFFCKKRLIYSHEHPEKVLELRVKDMKKALIRKDGLIRKHYQNLQKWASILRHGIPSNTPTDGSSQNQQQSQPESPVKTLPAQKLSAGQENTSSLQPPAIPVSSQLSPGGLSQIPAFIPQPASLSVPFFNTQSVQQNYGPGPGQYRQQGPQVRAQTIPAPAYTMPRSQMSGYQAQNVPGLPFGARPGVSPLSAMLQSGTSPMMQQHPMRAPSPSVPSPVTYGHTASPRMPGQWRPNVPMQPQQQQQPPPGYGQDS